MPWGNRGHLIFLLIVAGPALYLGMVGWLAVMSHLPFTRVAGDVTWRPSAAAALLALYVPVWFLGSLAVAVRNVRDIVRSWRARRRTAAMLHEYGLPYGN